MFKLSKIRIFNRTSKLIKWCLNFISTLKKSFIIIQTIKIVSTSLHEGLSVLRCSISFKIPTTPIVKVLVFDVKIGFNLPHMFTLSIDKAISSCASLSAAYNICLKTNSKTNNFTCSDVSPSSVLPPGNDISPG